MQDLSHTNSWLGFETIKMYAKIYYMMSIF